MYVEVIREASGTDINTIFGAVINESLGDDIIVTVIATGFDENKEMLQDSMIEQVIDMKDEVVSGNDTSDDDIYDIPDFLKNRINL